MRLTRETLIKIARDTANQRARVSRRIICIYLTGSVLSESPLLGGTTDIDLIMIHDSEPVEPREVMRMSDEIHLDIGHYPQTIFHQPRHLRADPWFGPFIYKKPMVLYENHHWFDFIQAATGAQFFQPDYVLQRANTLAQKARQSWMELELSQAQPHPQRVYGYLECLENAGNALVCLTGGGEPLAERRFMLQMPHRLQAFNQPSLISELVGLLIPELEGLDEFWPHWLEAWEEAYQAASSQEKIPPQLHACRHLYYERAINALWEESPTAALWLLLRTWTLAASHLPGDSPALPKWQSACQFLGLGSAGFAGRLQALDQYLDLVEETLEAWGNENGISAMPEP
jgi:hypothetical protein